MVIIMGKQKNVEKIITCQVCANHCILHVKKLASDSSEEEEMLVTGNQCTRGIQYGKETFLGTGSRITCKVATIFEDTPSVLVSTTKEVPGELAFKLRRYLKKMKITQRIPQGGLVQHEPLGIDTDIIVE